MKKKISVCLFAVALLAFLLPAKMCVYGAWKDKEADIVSQVKQQLTEVFENVDSDTAEKIFSFLKEKFRGEGLGSEEGLLAALEEGKEKFGVEIDKADAQKLVDTMEKLEEMGFSAEDILDKAESLYQQYGADFVDYMDEVVAGAVKNAASNAVSGFFGNVKKSVAGFFTNLFS